MTLFREKYRVESTRLQGRTYTENGMYFITICTKNRECVFGEIRNGIMGLSDIGNVLANNLQKIERLRYYITLDRWIVMPNHIHMILWINRNPPIDNFIHGYQLKMKYVCYLHGRDAPLARLYDAYNKHISVSSNHKSFKSRLHPHSIGSIIGQFKTVCTKRIHAMGYPDFAWQSRFYDHIIRDEKSLWSIRQYIRNNPLKWERDRNNPDLPDTP
ncbi:transposase [Patescibacteria group bacterium]|nr:transposase [Patescibacteria group bacterium]